MAEREIMTILILCLLAFAGVAAITLGAVYVGCRLNFWYEDQEAFRQVRREQLKAEARKR